MKDSSYNRPLHWLAIATTAATFPLIFMGGLVTSHQAGMSVPDWPNSWGYNMFLFPPRLWIGGILYEHTHRLMGTIVGMLAIALNVVAWWAEFVAVVRWIRLIEARPAESKIATIPRSTKWLCLGVLALVIFQGVLGGMRVVLVKLDLAIVHACVAQAFFCLAALSAMVTSKWWIVVRQNQTAPAVAKWLVAASVFAVVAIYAQLVVGATMRHYQAGLAVPDFPLAYGQVLPALDPVALKRINSDRIWKLDLPRVSANQIWLHLGHRLGAAIVSLAILLASGIVLARHRNRKILLVPAILLLVLLAGQITLGAYTVWLRKPADLASLHVAVGALTLLTAFILCTASIRIFGVRNTNTARLVNRESQFPGYGELATA